MGKRERVALSVLIVLAMVMVFVLPALADESPVVDGLEETLEDEVLEEDPVDADAEDEEAAAEGEEPGPEDEIEEDVVDEGAEDEEPADEEEAEDVVEETEEDPVAEDEEDVSAVLTLEAEDEMGSITVLVDDGEGLVFRLFAGAELVCEFEDDEPMVAEGLEAGVYVLESGFNAVCGFVVVDSQTILLEDGEAKTVEVQLGML